MTTSKILEPPADSALMLIDFQADFLDDDGRMPVARAHVVPMIAAAADAVELFKQRGRPVVAIGNEFRRSDIVMNFLPPPCERGRVARRTLGRAHSARWRGIFSQMGRQRLWQPRSSSRG